MHDRKPGPMAGASRKGGAALVALALAAGALSACSRLMDLNCAPDRPEGITVDDLAGTYRTKDGGTLTLTSDGTVTSRNVKISGWGSGTTRLTAKGTWKLNDAAGIQSEVDDDIDLSFRDAPGFGGDFGTGLFISGSRAKPWLYWFAGDPDSCELDRFDRT